MTGEWGIWKILCITVYERWWFLGIAHNLRLGGLRAACVSQRYFPSSIFWPWGPWQTSGNTLLHCRSVDGHGHRKLVKASLRQQQEESFSCGEEHGCYKLHPLMTKIFKQEKFHMSQHVSIIVIQMCQSNISSNKPLIYFKTVLYAYCFTIC